MLPAVGGGVKAGAAHSAQTLGGRVPEQAGDEFVDGEVAGFELAVAVVAVVETDDVVGEVEAVIVGQRAALDVAGEVEGHAVAVGIGLGDLDVPVAAPLVGDDGQPVVGGQQVGQLQASCAQRVLECAEKLAAKQCLQGFEGEEEILASGLPLVVRGKAPGGHQAVHVGVVAQGAAPGVQGHEQAGHGTEEFGVGAEFEQAVAGAVEQQLGHGNAVELPEREEFVRQGEDHVKVRTRQQLGQLGGQPLLARALGATRASAVPAGVVLDGDEVPLGTGQDMAAEFGAVAVPDAPGRAQLARVQVAHLRVGVEMLAEDVLDGAAHRRPRMASNPRLHR